MNSAGHKIRVLIVDDESLAREGIRLLLEDESEFEVIGESSDGNAAVNDILNHRPDLVFLDVQMPRVNGMELLRRIPPEYLPMVVFVTAFDQYAVSAFEFHALDYLLKPIRKSRFQETLKRVQGCVDEKRQLAVTRKLTSLLEELQLSLEQASSTQYPDRLAIRTTEQIYFVPVASVDWIEATDYYATLHVGSKMHLIRESLNSLEARLDPTRFVRIHRSTIVCIERIKHLRRQGESGYEVSLHDGTVLKMSRTYRAALQGLLGKR